MPINAECGRLPALRVTLLPVNQNLLPRFNGSALTGKNHRVGIEEMQTEIGSFRIYNREKTIVDCFRYRNKLGLDLAIEGLKNYLATFEHDTGKLIEYARFGRMFNVMKPYLDTLIRLDQKAVGSITVGSRQ